MTRKQVTSFTGPTRNWPGQYVGFYSDSGATTAVTVYGDQIASAVLASGKTGSSPVRRFRADAEGLVPPAGVRLWVDSAVTTLFARPESVTGVAVGGAAAVSCAAYGPDGPVTPVDPSSVAQLPAQTGQSGKYLTTDGTNPSWGTVAGGGGSSLTDTGVKTAGYTAVAGDLVRVDTTSGAVTVTLPSAPADKSQVAVKHVIQGGTNAVTVACAGSDVFNKSGGGTTLSLSLLAQGAILQYKATGAIWVILADDLPLSQLDARYVAVANAAVLDTTASDIQPNVTTGTPVAGAVGKAADAGHQHQQVAHDHTTANKGGTIPPTALLANAAGALVNDGSGGLSYVSLTAVSVNTQTASYTLVLADAGKVVEMNVAGANTLTVPPNSSVAFPVGTIIEVHQYGAGQVTLTPGAGVTLRNPSSLTTRAQYSTVALRKRATDEWVVSGDLT